VERDSRRCARLSRSLRRLLSFAALCTASTGWLAAGVAYADIPPSNSDRPAISGIAQQGDVLTASPGTWSGDDPITFSYLWSDGQVGSTATLSAADVGQSLTVMVTASNGFGQASATSDSFGPVLPAAPENSAAPQITGTAQQGATLSVSNGTWNNNPTGFTYVWEDCDGSGNNCATITGATSSSYTLQPSDVGSTVVASVTASNAGGRGTQTSASVGPVLPAAPVKVGAPVISGTAQQGSTLSVTTGTWGNSPTGFSYAWGDCNSSGSSCAVIVGATSTSYTLRASDVGSTVVASVTASNAGGQATQTSASVGPVLPAAPVEVGAPVMSGTAQQGNTLSVTTGTWGNSPTGFSYAWADCDGSGNNCTTIVGATSNSYQLRAWDVGSTVISVVTASNSGGTTPATSAAVGPVLPPAPASTKQPTITGTAQQGATLAVSNGTWSNSPTDFSYQWTDCSDSGGTICSSINGATSSTYTLQASDVGEFVSATVTASNSGGQTPATTSTVGRVLPAAPVNTTAPGISGAAQQGHTLTVGTGAWSNNPTAYSYVWQDCATSGGGCATISGAVSSTYTLQASDVGKYVSVTVTASNSGGHTSVNAASVGPVLPPPPGNTQAPVITGTAEQGGILSVSNGLWSNNPTTFGYAWEACDSTGTGCSPIRGATLSSYALSAADVGSRIVCVVTASGPGGSTSASTAETAVVVASPIPVSSQPTTTDLLSTPSTPVTNQSVTLIATVTAGTSSTALWGTVTVTNGGAAIIGCANMPVTPSGKSATVACSTSFAASTAQLSAVFTPTTGSILKGSASGTEGLVVAPDSSSTSLNASPSVNVGASTTYAASVAPPAARPGPVRPTGSVEFLDDGVPIGTCASQPLANGGATCTVNYAAAGPHSISVHYGGDANFTASDSSASQINAVQVQAQVQAQAPTSVLGSITSTMQWVFYYTPRYTVVRNLVVNAVSPGATVIVKCSGRGCPFATRATLLTPRENCRPKAARPCFALGTFNITPVFAGHRLAVGTRIAVSIIRANWIGKSYRFTVRARRLPRIQIGCLAPGGSGLGVGC
jgi:hypothetical protein